MTLIRMHYILQDVTAVPSTTQKVSFLVIISVDSLFPSPELWMLSIAHFGTHVFRRMYLSSIVICTSFTTRTFWNTIETSLFVNTCTCVADMCSPPFSSSSSIPLTHPPSDAIVDSWIVCGTARIRQFWIMCSALSLLRFIFLALKSNRHFCSAFFLS